MTEQEALHIVRNPWGHLSTEIRDASRTLADIVEARNDGLDRKSLAYWLERGIRQMQSLAPHAEPDLRWLLGWLLSNSTIHQARADEIMELFNG